ncbi:MAG: 50S ribosomal protein L21 [Bacilli bacterium]
MFAIIQTGGKQYKVSEGDTIYIEKLNVKDGKKVTFENVLMAGDKIGTPLVDGAVVEGVVSKHGKNKKIIVFKHKAKKGYKRKQGHRQPYTKVEIKKIKA